MILDHGGHEVITCRLDVMAGLCRRVVPGGSDSAARARTRGQMDTKMRKTKSKIDVSMCEKNQTQNGRVRKWCHGRMRRTTLQSRFRWRIARFRPLESPVLAFRADRTAGENGAKKNSKKIINTQIESIELRGICG